MLLYNSESTCRFIFLRHSKVLDYSVQGATLDKSLVARNFVAVRSLTLGSEVNVLIRPPPPPDCTRSCRNRQLEVLLRLKQQSNPAFSFLSDEDPVHHYYVFLKSWGEAALAAEYARQQRQQAERAEARRRREEQQRKEREERAAAAAAAAAAAKGPFGALVLALRLTVDLLLLCCSFWPAAFRRRPLFRAVCFRGRSSSA